MKRYLFLGGCLVLGVAFGLGTSIYRERRAETLGGMARGGSDPFVRPGSPAMGDPGAKVVVVKFTDPACETCAAFSGHLGRLVQAQPGRVRLVVRYAPFHEGSPEAVRALEGARRQGLFWEALHALYAHQDEWVFHHRVQPEAIWPVLARAGVNVAQARRDAGDSATDEILRRDLSDAQTLGVRKTPGIFVNGRPLEPFGLETLRRLVELELGLNYR